MSQAQSRGTVIGERFVIERLAGQGGMGQIFRALDEQTGQPVAVKVLQRLSKDAAARFLREAQLLKDLSHPGIVKYIANGVTAAGELYLVMEWLEGVDLNVKLSTSGLTVRETVTLLRLVADALAVAHGRGIVHRDLKPSNIFLVDGQVENARVLDLGMARQTGRAQAMTQTGVVVGTPDYMAPEQARGQRNITLAADIFSLGCILFECLIGRPPFIAEHMVAVLAKILFDEVPPICALRPELPASLDSLVRRMLAKDPAERPADATFLQRELAAIGDIVIASDSPPARVWDPPASSLTAGERYLISIVMARDGNAVEHGRTIEFSPLLEGVRPMGQQESLRSSFGQFGARGEWLADGSLVVTLMRVGSATDQAAQAARCALHIHESWPEAIVVLATGRGMLDDQGHLPMGEAIDWAAALTRSLMSPAPHRDSALEPQATDAVHLDDVTAALLDARFIVTRKAVGGTLHGERVSTDDTRLLLGKPTPCLGREGELRMLESCLAACIEEPKSQAILVTASPGFGKSRLRHEYLRRLQNDARWAAVQLLFGRGDLMTAGSPYASLAHALLRLCDITRGDPQQRQRTQLSARLSLHLPPADHKRVVEFLGELCGVPFPDGDSVQLRAARQDPKVMSDQVRSAFVDFITAECAHHPVLLVLEDLHWGDAPTVKLTDAVLRATSNLPFMALALARPEVHDLFPNLWIGNVQEIPLHGLGNRAGERLVKQVLGDRVDAATVARIVRQSAGNALFLEELIRTIAEGKGDKPPETVLAMLQARLSSLDPDIRRLLRAASIFGESFWGRGARLLCGTAQNSEITENLLGAAVEQELIERSQERRFPAEEQYRFRHALMRDAAYSMLTDEDRLLGHRLAAQFLREVGEPDPMVLGDHHALGGDTSGAIPYYIRAADQALAGNDLVSTLSRVERGLSCSPQGEALGQLRGMQCFVYFWNDQWATAHPFGTEALALLPVGSFRWCRTMGPMLTLTSLSGKLDHFGQLVGAFAASQPDPDARNAYTEAASMLVTTFGYLGRRPQAEMFVSRLEQIGSMIDADDAATWGWIRQGQVYYFRLLGADPWTTLQVAQAGNDAFLRAGSTRNVIILKNFLGLAQAELGDFAAGEATLREALALAQGLKESLALLRSMICLAYLLGGSDDPKKYDEAYTLAQKTCNTKGVNSIYLAMSLEVMAQVSRNRGDFVEAEALSRRALEGTARFPVMRMCATRLLIAALLSQGRSDEAASLADSIISDVASNGGAGFVEIGVLLAAAEARQKSGNLDGAKAALELAQSELTKRADHIPDSSWRARYLEQVPTNVRLQQLARELSILA